MNLTFHHFKKDVRQFRLLLAIWFGLLLIDFAVNIGWVGNVEYSPSRGFDNGSNTWTGLLPTVLWAFAGILPSLVVLADSPARHEGFHATRPIRRRELLLAKLLFVLGLIVVPWTLSEALYLAAERLPGWVIQRGSLERLMVLVPLTFGCGAFATLWPSAARWVRALGIAFACYVITGLLYSFGYRVLHISWLNRIGQAPGILAPYLIVLALMLFATWHARGHRSWGVRWLGLFVCILSGWIGGSFWKWEPVGLRPENSDAAKITVAEAGLNIPASGVALVRESDADQAEGSRFNLSLIPEFRPLPKAEVIEWSGSGPHLIRTNGTEISGARRSDHVPLFQPYYWDQRNSFEEVAAWATFFPSEILFRHSEHGPVSYQSAITFSGFHFPQSESELSEPLQLKAELEARVFEWRKIADLPLTPGATATNDFGFWKIISSRTREYTALADVYVERGQIELITADNSRCSSAYGGPLNRMKVMVYDPQDQVAWLAGSYSMNAATRASHTGFIRHYVQLSFNQRPPFTPGELSRMRLVILEKAWIGSVPERWESTAFTLKSKLPRISGVANRGNSQDTLTRTELNRRLAALKKPEANAPRREMSLYLLEYFRLLDAYGGSFDAGSSEVTQLASLVPPQLSLFLDGLPAMGWASKNTVLTAIATGALEDQKTVVIAAVRSEPFLAEVLLKRGWTEDARSELYAILEEDANVPFAVFQSVALFRDLKTYPWLLNAFSRRLDTSADELLHRMGLGDQAGEIVRRKWDRDKLIWWPGSPMFSSVFPLALKHGDYSALQRAFVMAKLTKDRDANFEPGLFDGFRKGVQMPDVKLEDRNDDQATARWMEKHQPEDFVFSPARRQFVLKPLTNSVAALTNDARNP